MNVLTSIKLKKEPVIKTLEIKRKAIPSYNYANVKNRKGRLKIALVAPGDFHLWTYRRGLMRSLLAMGHEVVLVSNPGEFTEKLKKLGGRHVSVNMERFISPIADLRLLFEYYKIFKKEKFDIVHNFTVKPNNFGTLMAYAAGCKTILNSVTGLGFMVTEHISDSFSSKLIKAGIRNLYKLSSRIAYKTWFQNTEDENYFIKNNIIHHEKTVKIRSSGINLQEWACPKKAKIEFLKRQMGFHSDDILVVMVTRILRSKGILEYIYAMEQLTKKYKNVKFLLVGGIEDNERRGVSTSYLLEKTKNPSFFWLGYQKDVIDLTGMADIIVLPSYYREGVPKNLLEAMALKKPIVTTDNVGCREAVKDGVNGYLVPIKDGKAVAEKLELLVQNPDLRSKMGNAGFKKVKQEFEESLVINALLENLYQFRKHSE